MNKIKTIWNFISGYKTYCIAIAAIIYGIYIKDVEIVLLALGMIGLRDGLTTEITKKIIKK